MIRRGLCTIRHIGLPASWMLGAVVAVCASAGRPASLSGQAASAELLQLRAEYRGTVNSLEAARASYEVAESRFQQALDSVTVARESGDEARLERALSLAQARAQPVRSAEARIRQTSEAVERARQALVAGLEGTLDRLYAMEDTIRVAGLADLRVTIVDMENELDEVRGSLADFEVQPAILLQLRIDPTDGPRDILNKADLLERRAARHAAQIQEVDEQLEKLRKRARLERLRSTNMAGVSRFDDGSPPVGAARRTVRPSRGDDAIPMTDSAGVPIRPLTLEEEIRTLEQLREDLISLHDRILEQASTFRARAGGGR